MTPSSTRWRPRRAGIIALYEYADQVFDFAGGRLLLRGHNTSGKTKALELLLPFCLDGDISPNKLDPFGAAYKDMKWNLVGCTDDEKRIGYVWLEFERLDASGAMQRITAGVGMRASKALPDVTRWYFVVRNRAIGSDLELLRGREPISRSALIAALGDDGEVLDSQRDYRGRLNDLLFGFSGEEQYQTMLRLMRDLRRPHLSKTLDPDRVASQLTVGLPEVDEALMRRLAGGLEQIETLERGLARLRDVRDRVRRFYQRTYSAYARAVVRERADALRQAQTAVENAAEALRMTCADLDAQRELAAKVMAARDAADSDAARLGAERDALVSSEAWSSVAEIEALGEHAVTQRRAADEARRHADSTAAAAITIEAELIAARAAAEERRVAAESDLTSVVELAAGAGLAKRTEVLVGQLREESLTVATWQALMRDLATDWRDVLHHHRELLEAAAQAAAACERARADEREAGDRVEHATAKLALSEDQLEQEREAFSAAFAAWRAGLVELALDEENASAALKLGHHGRPVGPAITTAAQRLRSALADQRASVQSAHRATSEAVTAAEAEIERLLSARDDGPPLPAWPRADRGGRRGAPLWRLVDFREDLPEGQRAALEAALEAAGLLDAWVTPDGQLEDRALADVVLSGGEPAVDRSLREVLEPLPGQPVAEAVLRTLLGCIGLGERDTGPWVDLEGHFALGPLAGRGVKDVAEHIGAAAREARRAVRVAELQAQIGSLEAEIAALDAELDQLDRRRVALDAELGALPEVAAITAALEAVRVAGALHAEAAQAHERAAAAARAAAEIELAADAARRDHAATHGLPAARDAAALDGLRESTAELIGAAGTAARSWEHAAREQASAAAVQQRLAAAQIAADDQDRKARDERVEADRLTAEHATREAALGATGEELRRRHGEVASALKAAREAHRHAGEATSAALIAVAGLERDAESRGAEHEAARARREAASVGFRQLAQAAILELVLGEDTPTDAEQAGTWTFTRALEVARTLPANLVSARSSSGERELDVQRGVQLLDRELAEAEMGAYASRDQDGLLLVHVTETGSDQPLTRIIEILATEITDREQVLSAEERRVFNDALVEEIADHLRQRIHVVRGRVQQMNAVLRRSPTAADKTVELEWQPTEDDQGTQRAAVTLLRPDVRHLGEDDREQLIAFFRSRIESARREYAWEEQPQPMADTLMRAFDYRSWFAFGLFERSSTGRTRLTKRRHAVGSGGEQSVLIHLPLFAAAAALYGDGHAPRLIMLDEALSGIDDETRERVLQATVAFDLDLVMTSHELWGTYRSVPQLAIYQLHRDNGAFGVHAIPFLWDGDVLHELEQGELLV